MKIKSSGLVVGVCLALISVANPSHAQQPDWLKDLAAHLPNFTISASPISRQGALSPDGKWLATGYIADPGSKEPGIIGTEQYGVQILDRTGTVVLDVMRRDPRFLSVTRFGWGKDRNTLYFEYGSRMHPGNAFPDGPVIWQADLRRYPIEPLCTKTSFTQMPVWSPRGDSYLIADVEHLKVTSVQISNPEKWNIFLINSKRKTRIEFHDACSPSWSPNGRWIRLVNQPATPKRQNPYLRIADSRTGKEHAFTATMSSASENRRYGWVSTTVDPGACWLADSEHLLMGVNARKKDVGVVTGCCVMSSKDGSRSFVPNIYPMWGSRDGRSILIQLPDKKLFILDILPKHAT